MKSILKLEDYLLLEQNIEELSIFKDLSFFNQILRKNSIEGGFLDKEESEKLQKEIIKNYSDKPKFGQDNNDIRTFMFNYEHPIAQKYLNNIDLRIVSGLIEGEAYSGKRRNSYLLYASGNLIGKFYSIDDIKNIIKFIEDRLIKEIN